MEKGGYVVISLSNVTKKYSNGHGVENVSLHVSPGEIVFLTGPSGVGKTTIMKLLLREFSPDSGDIIVNGWSLKDMEKNKIPYYRREIGPVFQDYRLLQNKTVEENISVSQRIAGMGWSEGLPRLREALALVGMAARGESFPSELSGGEQQMVAIARAVVNQPKIILADEPTGNLDDSSSDDVFEILRFLCKEGKTVVVATHDVSKIKKNERVITMDAGHIVSDNGGGLV